MSWKGNYMEIKVPTLEQDHFIRGLKADWLKYFKKNKGRGIWSPKTNYFSFIFKFPTCKWIIV